MKNHLINNIISLGTHGLVILVFYILNISKLYFSAENAKSVMIVMTLLTVLLYLLSGFFVLKWVKDKHLFSVISVLIAELVGMIWFVAFYDGSYSLIAYINPLATCIVALLSDLFKGGIATLVTLVLSLPIPSMLIYLGKLLRKVISRNRAES